MKSIKNITLIILLSTFLIVSCKSFFSQKVEDSPAIKIEVNMSTKSPFYVDLTFEKGTEHNHPLMAVWAEDLTGKYLETFYIAKSIGTGIFEHAIGDKGKWQYGPICRPAALPYWAHKRGVKEANGFYNPTPQTAMSDAVAGATPKGDFELKARPTITDFPKKFNIMFEINQSWDWNEFWTNTMFLDEPEYKTFCQPSLIFQATVDATNPNTVIELKPIGHGHYSGNTGDLFSDLSTITTALKIAKQISVTLKTE
jgi:hypothetical protein